MKKKLFEKLIDRSKHFLKIAIFDAKNEKYDIALVHLEQALQLLLKAKIYEKTSEFPITHSIKILLKELNEKEIIEKNREIINVLETAYIAGRYYDIEYEKKDFEIAFEFVKSIFKKYGIEID